MDVTFAGNSNEVTPWCKIEFNYRNDFDNYTRWKLREVIKVVVYLYNFFSVLLAWYKSKDCMSIDNGIFWENKASVSKKKISGCFSLMFCRDEIHCVVMVLVTQFRPRNGLRTWAQNNRRFFCLISIPTCWSFNSPSHYYQNLENLIDLGYIPIKHPSLDLDVYLYCRVFLM